MRRRNDGNLGIRIEDEGRTITRFDEKGPNPIKGSVKPGDRIYSIDGKRLLKNEDAQTVLANCGDVVNFVVVRKGNNITFLR